jgi:arylsulfatase A-like enzyme
MDSFIGKFLRFLEKNNSSKKTMVVIFGDHGEGHGEREGFFGHTRFLNRQFIHVPLIMHLPGIKGKRLNTPVSLVCVSPTVLEYLGIRDRSFNYKESILKGMQKGKLKDRFVYSFTSGPSSKRISLSIIKWPYQSIYYLDQKILKKRELYNLVLSQSFSEKDALDDYTIRNISRHDYKHIHKKFNQLRKKFAQSSIGDKIRDDKMQEKIKTLGYVNN